VRHVRYVFGSNTVDGDGGGCSACFRVHRIDSLRGYVRAIRFSPSHFSPSNEGHCDGMQETPQSARRERDASFGMELATPPPPREISMMGRSGGWGFAKHIPVRGALDGALLFLLLVPSHHPPRSLGRFRIDRGQMGIDPESTTRHTFPCRACSLRCGQPNPLWGWVCEWNVSTTSPPRRVREPE
jgi:hypothetical protein